MFQAFLSNFINLHIKLRLRSIWNLILDFRIFKIRLINTIKSNNPTNLVAAAEVVVIASSVVVDVTKLDVDPLPPRSSTSLIFSSISLTISSISAVIEAISAAASEING